MRIIKYMLLALVFLGCGTQDNVLGEASVVEKQKGKAQLGVLSKATVKLYELNGVERKLLATDVTSSGTTIDEIGNFRLFLHKLENEKFYLYEISGGEDYDVEDDGRINTTPTSNKGTFNLLVKGQDLQTLGSAKVTLVSEIVYQRVQGFLSGDTATLENEIDKVIKELITTDVNGNGTIGLDDLLSFDPVSDKEKLASNYQENFRRYAENILNDRDVEYEPDPESVVKPTVKDVSLEVFENLIIGTLIGDVNITSIGDSNITSITLFGDGNQSFAVSKEGKIKVLVYLDYESRTSYNLEYSATNDAGESNKALFTIGIKNIVENTGSDYVKDETGIQTALDNGDNDFILNELLNNREGYSGMSDDEVNVNIAAAYVGKSDYTIFDIVGAMNNSEQNNSFNGFVDSITTSGDSVAIIENLQAADNYYTEVVAGLDCNNTAGLTDAQKDSCLNLGLVRLTSMSNSIKLLFGGDSETVSQWSNGIDANSSDDLNANGVVDKADASSCAVVYASDPGAACKDGSNASYRGNITFSSATNSYKVTLIEVDVGSPTNGYNTFYKLITNKPDNNSPLLTSGVCMSDFTTSTGEIDGVTYFPCPTLNSSSQLMELKDNLEQGANIQSLFPHGSETKDTLENYIENITGSKTGTVGLDNLADYLQVN